MPKIFAAELPNPAAGTDLYRALLEQQWRAQLDVVTRLSLELADAHDDGSSVTRRLLSAARLQLDETEAALGRLDEGRYGICAGCHLPIPQPRLTVLPTARLCVTCIQAFRGSEPGGAMPGTRTAPHSVPR